MDKQVRRAKTFWADREGNIAMLWALVATAFVGLVGLSIDFTRAQSMRAAMQNAADGAVLVAERSTGLSDTEKTEAARAYFDATVGELPIEGDINFYVNELEDGGHRVTAGAYFDNGLSLVVKLLGTSVAGNWRVEVSAEAMASASPPIEVALALDNTGSMSNDMATLIDGAQNLVDFLLGIDGDSVSVGIVPFVAQVNIGADAPTSWLDTTGANPHHGEFFEDRYMGRRNATGTPAACTNTTNFPTTFGGMPVRWIQGSAATPGYTNTGRCYAFAPSSVNIFTLYASMPATAAWKGCVESRPPPYDINDSAPSAGTPATLFVPFMSMDEGGDDTDNNNWITSSTYDRTDVFGLGSSFTAATGNRTTSPYKYRSGVTVSITNDNTTSAKGPNRGCPTEIVPLTTDKDTIDTAVQGMLHWYGGGTNQVEGLTWAWKVLSPTAPYTEGRPYDDPDDPVRKVIVLFTDGANRSLDSNNDMFESDYNAMNVRRLWRVFETETQPSAGSPGIDPTYRRSIANLDGSGDEADMITYVNGRQLSLCSAIRDLDIEIYTIGFRMADGSDEEQLLEDCATQDDEHFFDADNASELLSAFDAIGSGIGELRITK